MYREPIAPVAVLAVAAAWQRALRGVDWILKGLLQPFQFSIISDVYRRPP
jgi:hypothetical protein